MTVTTLPALTTQVVSAAKLDRGNIGDHIEFTQQNGSGLVVISGTIDSATQYRPLFESARVIVDGALCVIRYSTPVTITRKPGRLPMTGADFVALTPKPAKAPEPARPIVEQDFTAGELTDRHLGWTFTAEGVSGILERVAESVTGTIAVRIDGEWFELDREDDVTVGRFTGPDPEDLL